MPCRGSPEASRSQAGGKSTETNRLQMVIPVDGMCKKMNTPA